MPALSDRGRLAFVEILAAELGPRAGRWEAVARIATATAITVGIAMTFQIPEPDYMAYIVFLISRDDRNATIRSALGGFAAVTLAILLTLVLALIDTAEPALRLPAMALMTFVAMYTTRTFALGPLTYLAGFVTVLLHSLIDDVPSPEAFTRATLWVWVIVAVPVAVTVTIHALFGHNSEVTAERRVRTVLAELQAALDRNDFRHWLPQWRRDLVPLLEGPSGRMSTQAVPLLLEALTILEMVPDSRVRDGSPASPAELAFSDCLTRLQHILSNAEAPVQVPPENAAKKLFVADAFTNPAYWQFALKTTAAVMVSYAIYTLLDWPGLRTAIVTCFFVSLSSLGETVHKLLLRMSGAVLGGVLAGLCIVFVLPSFTDVGQLCLLIALVSLGAAWVATSGEVIAYAGMQIAFAFFLGILQGYGPATDLTVLRDRVVGILLGNIVITLVFSVLWPESARAALRDSLSRVMRSLGEVLKGAPREARTEAVRALASAEHFEALSTLELRMLATHEPDVTPALALSGLQRLAGATLVAAPSPLPVAADTSALTKLGDWMEVAAERVTRQQSLPELPEVTVVDPATAIVTARPAECALEQLKTEMAHVASASN